MTLDEAVDLGLGIQGWKTREELFWMARQASLAQWVLDVGCWRGRTTKVMAAVCPGTIVAVDHLSGAYTDETARNKILKDYTQVDILRDFLGNLEKELHDGKVFGIFENGDEARKVVVEFLGHTSVDFVWIDGDHAYDDVKADILAYLPLVRPGGIFAGHDYDPAFPGVVRAVRELVPGFETGHGSMWYAKIS